MAPVFSDALIEADERPSSGEIRYRVALLTGCVQDLVFPTLNRDTADVLLANGCQVHTPPVQPCCGSLHAHNGERELARLLARRLIDLLPPDRYDAIITNAGGCGSHLRHYAPLLSDDSAYAARARLWDTKIRDVHEWLVAIGYRSPEAGPFDVATTVTYHDSCHLAHGQRVVSEPRTILGSMRGVRMVELPEANWCCGSAGIYNITQPEQSDKLLDRKVRHISETQRRWWRRPTPAVICRSSAASNAAGTLSRSERRCRFWPAPIGTKRPSSGQCRRTGQTSLCIRVNMGFWALLDLDTHIDKGSKNEALIDDLSPLRLAVAVHAAHGLGSGLPRLQPRPKGPARSRLLEATR